MAAMGAGKPQSIITLPSIDKAYKAPVLTAEDQQRILNKWQHLLQPKK